MLLTTIAKKNLENWLELNSAPKRLIAAIISEYASTRGDYAGGQSATEVAPLIARLALDNSRLNRERIIKAIAKARADVLLDVVDRYPAVTHSEVDAVLEVRGEPKCNISTDAQNEAHSQKPSSSPPLSKGETSSEMPQLAVSNMLEEVFNAWRSKNPDKAASDETDPAKVEAFRQHRQTTLLFQRVLEHHGVRYLHEVQQWHVREFRDLLGGVYRHWGRGLRHDQSYPSVAKLMAGAQQAKAAGKPIGLDTTTVRRHMITLGQLVDFLQSAGFRLKKPDTSSLTPAKKESQELNELEDDESGDSRLSPEEAAAFTRLPLYTGCAGPGVKEIELRGTHIYQCG